VGAGEGEGEGEGPNSNNFYLQVSTNPNKLHRLFKSCSKLGSCKESISGRSIKSSVH
jgi:hypothetical protein